MTYSEKRGKKDKHNRLKGLRRLEKKVKGGKLTKAQINNRGYSKYLRLSGSVEVEIDYEGFDRDAVWDGLKGYVTNTELSVDEVVENYSNLWQIEKAFRISKTDLKIRPIYHRLRNRIEAHICISFTAYTVYKELERILKKNRSGLSVKKAAELTHNMYEIYYTLPESLKEKSKLLKMDDEQNLLKSIIDNHY